MGIGYIDSIVLYNRYIDGIMETEYYIGTRFDNVRVELTQGANIRTSGLENADSCLVKIPKKNLPKPYAPPKIWIALPSEEKLEKFTIDTDSQTFFSIVKKEELEIDIDLPEGLINGADYKGGFYQSIRNKYGYTYAANTADVYKLIPRYEVSGA